MKKVKIRLETSDKILDGMRFVDCDIAKKYAQKKNKSIVFSRNHEYIVA